MARPIYLRNVRGTKMPLSHYNMGGARNDTADTAYADTFLSGSGAIIATGSPAKYCATSGTATIVDTALSCAIDSSVSLL